MNAVTKGEAQAKSKHLQPVSKRLLCYWSAPDHVAARRSASEYPEWHHDLPGDVTSIGT